MFKKKETKYMVKKTIVWSAVNGWKHPQMTEEENAQNYVFENLVLPVLPGIRREQSFFGVNGTPEIVSLFIVPAMKKLCPEMIGCEPPDFHEETMEIKMLMPVDGYEWIDDPENFKKKFLKALSKYGGK